LVEPPAGVDVLAVQTPGRENRSHEPALDRVDAIVDAIVPTLRPLLDRPLVVWGHSFGGIVAHELALRLRAEGIELGGLLVTGSIAPQQVETWQRREVMLRTTVDDNDAEYLMSLSRYVEDTEFIRAILPLMRKDTPLLMNFRYRDDAPLNCPITAFSARQDDMVYADEIAPWRDRTVAEFVHHRVDGDHWFIDRNRASILAALGRLIAQA
jgi:surfactin synthase thioesterase subunit